MVRRCIINIGSVTAARGDWNQDAYNVTKRAVANPTNAMALGHGRRIRDAVHPGVTTSHEYIRYIRVALADCMSLRERSMTACPCAGRTR
ncbi:hypothetical protein Acsp02_95290 [Actinoplanes sp. NBRC 103695]|nr:hypothetical protein Acsp02_95290 [Actinoplanes sp. NBRC 103695]